MIFNKWLHIHFYFKEIEHITDDISASAKARFEVYLAEMINLYGPLIRRKFYLYEPDPHCFLAIEARWWILKPLLIGLLKIYARHKLDFFREVFVVEDTADRQNGEGFLNVLNAWTDFWLFRRDNKISHILHCSMEFIWCERVNELRFYKKMLVLYGGAKYQDIKIVDPFSDIAMDKKE